MRKAKALLLPFYCDGYKMDVAQEQIALVRKQLEDCDLEIETAEPIGSTQAAEAASRAYNPYCYDLAILFPVTWSEPRLASIAARQFFGMPIAVWCVGEFLHQGRRTEMSSAPAGAALHGCLQEMGVKCEFFSGLTVTEKMRDKLTALASAARAISLLRNTKMAFFGHNFNGITAADFDLGLLRRKLGTEVYAFDCSELIARMEKLDTASEEYKAMEKRVADRLVGDTGIHFQRIVRMCTALRQYIAEYDLGALDIRCHTELSQTFGLSACLPLAILGDELPASCEADIPVMLTQVILHYLSGGETSAYVDLRTFTEDGMDSGACGTAPCALTGGKAKVSGPEAPENGNPEGYLTNCSGFMEGRLTMARLLKFPGGKLKLHITGATARKEESFLQEMGCPYYPMAKLQPDIPMDQFTDLVGANHYALVYANVLPAARYFCKYAEIDWLQ